jgi:hypothetical protein
MYRTLNASKIIDTLEALERRISARFYNSGLARVCNELTAIARESSKRVEQIGRRNVPLRIGVTAILAGGIWLLVRLVPLLTFEKLSADNVYSVIQGVDAAMNILIFMGAALVFLVTVEERLKRKRALDALNELRSIIHVIDMHQLTKDPSLVGVTGTTTAASPARTFTPFELTRYLDYCSEMLSLSAKVAALYAQSFPDPVVTEAVSDLERITANLSQKIWQKISLVQSQTSHGTAVAGHAR